MSNNSYIWSLPLCMKRNDYIKLLVSGLLQVHEAQFQILADFIATRFEIKELYKPKLISLGGIGPNSRLLGLIDWVLALRSEQVKSVTAFHGSYSEVPLEAHLAAAFAGIEDMILNVQTGAGNYFYILKVQYSPRNQMTPQQLVLLVNRQQDPKAQWKSLETVVQKSNELNDRPRIAEGSLASYIISPEGMESFDWHSGDFIKELQLHAIVNHQEFIIPETLKHLLHQSSFSFGDEGKVYTYLYPVDEVSGEELRQLIAAQPFEDEVWEKMIKYNKDYDSDRLPSYATIQEWKENSTKLSGDELTSAVSVGCRAICECCDAQGLKPVIPELLKQKIGPDEEEAKRTEGRSKLEHSEWFLSANNEPWEVNLLQPVYYETSLPATDSYAASRKAFQEAISPVEAFATKQQSNFAEAFALAKYLVSDAVPSGSFDEAHKERIIQELKAAPLQFSERAIENFSNVFYFSEELLLMNWEPSRIFALMAISLADVFGGMGSWNDVYYEAEEDNAKHQQLSSELYSAMRNYFASLISTVNKK